MQKYADKRLYKPSNEGKINEKDLFVEPSLKGTYEKPNTLKKIENDSNNIVTYDRDKLLIFVVTFIFEMYVDYSLLCIHVLLIRF